MAITWTDFSNGDKLDIVRSKLNTFNNSSVVDSDAQNMGISNNATNISNLANTVESNTTKITNNTTNLNNNTSNIADNTNTIATNVIEIDNVKTRVTALEATPVMSYDYSKVIDFTVADDTYEIIASVATPPRDAGTYEFKFSGTYILDSITSSAYLRFSIDGGTSWTEARREPKDKTDANTFYYAFPKEIVAGNINVIVEVRKEVASDVLVYQFFDIIVDRKA